MGPNAAKQQRIVPDRGYRVISITKKHIASQLNLLTDYIISPDPKLIDLRRDSIRFEVYSILAEDIRSVELPVSNRELGLQVRLDDINTCILRITKIFQGSPLQKYNIQTGQFIVGVLQGNFSCIKTFAQLISNITTMAPKSNVSLGVCGDDGRTRIVVMPVAELKAWQAKRKGLLGCELAEGWIHKWKPLKQKKSQQHSNTQQPKQTQQQKTTSTSSTPQIPIPRRPSQQSQEHQKQQQHSDSSEEVDRKCDALDSQYNGQGVLEIRYNYKGIMKNQEIADASTICRCRPIDRLCQRCFIQKDGDFYFFNKRANQIVAIPTKMMLPTGQE